MFSSLSKSFFISFLGLSLLVGCSTDKKIDGVWKVSDTNVTATAATAVDPADAPSHFKFEAGKMTVRINNKWSDTINYTLDGDTINASNKAESGKMVIEDYSDSRFVLKLPIPKENVTVSMVLTKATDAEIAAISASPATSATAAVSVNGIWQVTSASGAGAAGFDPNSGAWLVRFSQLAPNFGELDTFQSSEGNSDWSGHDTYVTNGSQLTVGNVESIKLTRTGNTLVMDGTGKDGKAIHMELTLIDELTATQIINEYKP